MTPTSNWSGFHPPCFLKPNLIVVTTPGCCWRPGGKCRRWGRFCGVKHGQLENQQKKIKMSMRNHGKIRKIMWTSGGFNGKIVYTWKIFQLAMDFRRVHNCGSPIYIYLSNISILEKGENWTKLRRSINALNFWHLAHSILDIVKSFRPYPIQIFCTFFAHHPVLINSVFFGRLSHLIHFSAM